MPKWKPICDAPQDGTVIHARGRNWGKLDGAWHYGDVFWNGKEWTDNQSDPTTYIYLVEFTLHQERDE